MKKTYSLLGVTSGETYRQLMNVAEIRCQTFSLVLRDEPLDSSCEAVLTALEPHLTTSVRTTEWPGTVLHRGQATLTTYRFTPESREILLKSATTLDDWQHPALPEDLSLYRPDGSPWFVLISHEGDAYLELTVEEREGLAASNCRLALVEDESTE